MPEVVPTPTGTDRLGNFVPHGWPDVPHNRGMSLAQACAEVEAIIERARSLFAANPEPYAAAGQLSATSLATATAGQGIPELSGELMGVHRGFTERSATTLEQVAGADARLSAQVAQAAELTRSGAARLTALAQESHETARAAATVTTAAGQRAILTALKSQVDRAAQIVNETQQRAGELAGHTQLLDYPADIPPSVP
jgi:hypothetical protein